MARQASGWPGKTSVSMGYGIFYNPIEQLVLEQFSAEPPFGGSNFITSPLLQTPYVSQSGDTFPNPFNGILNPPRGSADRLVAVPADDVLRRVSCQSAHAVFGPIQPDDQAPVAGRYSSSGRLCGIAGHRLLASYEINPGNPTTCNDLRTSNLTGDTSGLAGHSEKTALTRFRSRMKFPPA